MKVDVLTIFPEFFGHVFEFGIIHRAMLAGIGEKPSVFWTVMSPWKLVSIALAIERV